MISKHQFGPLRAGWRLLWQTRRILWWIYGVNLGLGLLSAWSVAHRVGSVLDHSLAAGHLYHGFDLAYFMELAAHPDVQLWGRSSSALISAAVFFVFMLFATGGVLETYARDRGLVAGEFLQASGAFFWRLSRLVLCFAGVLAFIAWMASLVNRLAGWLSDHSSYEKLGFWVALAGLTLVSLLAMTARLWFDMAQAGVVVEDERSMMRALGRSCRFVFGRGNFVPLFWIYLRLSLLAWGGTGLALYIWVKFVPAERVWLAFLLGQFIAWLWTAARLWQRASEMTWYLRHRPAPEIGIDTQSPVIDIPTFAPGTENPAFAAVEVPSFTPPTTEH